MLSTGGFSQPAFGWHDVTHDGNLLGELDVDVIVNACDGGVVGVLQDEVGTHGSEIELDGTDALLYMESKGTTYVDYGYVLAVELTVGLKGEYKFLVCHN